MTNFDILRVDGHLLRVFLAIYSRQSVSQAALDLNLTQSTVSHSLEKLRQCVGDPLFVRAGRGLVPTEFTVALVPSVRDVLSRLEGLAQRDTYDPQRDDKPLTVVANVTELMPEIDHLVTTIAAVAPKMKLRLLELGSRDNIEPMLESEGADLVLTVRRPSYPRSLQAVSLFSDRMVIFYDAQMRGPVTSLQDYGEARHATLDFGGVQKSTVAIKLEQIGLSRDVVLSVSNAFALGMLLRGTDMIATMQRRLAQSAFAGLRYCELPMDPPKVDFDLIWHRRAEHSGRNQWARQLVIEHIPQFANALKQE